MPLDADVQRILEAPNFGHLATLMADGSPQVSPVWVDTDGDHVLVNTSVGRLKWRNVQRDPRVAISVADSADPYRKVLIRGRVLEMREKGAEEHIHRMARKYRGVEHYALGAGERRVLLVIEAERVSR